MSLISKPKSIKIKKGALTKECVGCEVEWRREGNPFDTKDAYLVSWDDETEQATIQQKGKKKKVTVPYSDVELHYIQLEKGWIFDGDTALCIDPEQRLVSESITNPKPAQSVKPEPKKKVETTKKEEPKKQSKNKTNASKTSSKSKSTSSKKKESSNAVDNTKKNQRNKAPFSMGKPKLSSNLI